MRNNSDRKIKVNKANLIEKIKANKINHIKDYKEAVEAYRTEAKRQLDKQLEDLAEGKLTLKLNLITPVNQEKEYDKILEVFTWEIEDEVELSQEEFNQYVLDETSFAIHARMLNSSYK